MLDAEALLSAAASAEAREELLESQPHLPAYVLNRCAPCVTRERSLVGTSAGSSCSGSALAVFAGIGTLGVPESH